MIDKIDENCNCVANVVNTEDLENEVKIFPNPTNGLLNIKYTYPKAFNYQILDLTGKVVQEGEITEFKIPTQELARGIYFLKLIFETGNVFEIRKIIKN